MPTAGRGSARAAIGQWGGGRHSLVDRLCGWWVVSSEGPRQARGACLGGRSFCGRVPVAAAKRNDKQAGRRDGEKERTGRSSRAVAGEKRGREEEEEREREAGGGSGGLWTMLWPVLRATAGFLELGRSWMGHTAHPCRTHPDRSVGTCSPPRRAATALRTDTHGGGTGKGAGSRRQRFGSSGERRLGVRALGRRGLFSEQWSQC